MIFKKQIVKNDDNESAWIGIEFMDFRFTGDSPLFQQVAEQISEGIFNGSFPEGTQIPSTTEISKKYQINPATVLKGMNLLIDLQLIEKKRGIGMFVSENAQIELLKSRKTDFIKKELPKVFIEAKKLGISKAQLKALIESGYTDEFNN